MATAEVPVAQPLQVDDNTKNDPVAEGNESTYTQSLRSSLLEALQENGRGYHKYRSDAAYILPEDKREQDRLDLQHNLFLKSFGGDKLYLAPLGDKTRSVLDLGTGTGIWAIEFADEHSESDVLGIDLSPIQPSWVPSDCKFEVDDFDSEWTYTQDFDYIHARMINSTCASFPKLFQQSFDHLTPGGWLEMQDVYLPILDDDGSMASDLKRWNELFEEACLKMGRDPKDPARYKQWMVEVGFEGVTEKVFKWPINTWPKDPQMKDIGEWNLINMLDGLEGFTWRLWMKVLGWSVEETQAFLQGVRRDLQDRKSHAYFRMYVVYGQKPASS